MNLKLSAGLFAILLFVSSCEKEFNDLGASLLPSDTFVIEKETAPVGLGHKSIEIVRTDNLSFFSLGEYEDAAFGNTKASFTTQLSLATSSTGTFGSMSPATETNGVTSDTTNKNPHDEQETVTEVWLEIPFYTNQRDRDGDGVIDSLDADPDDPQSDSDGDTLTDIDESRSGNLDPLNPDTDGDGLNDAEDDETVNPDNEANVYEIDYLFGDTDQELHFQVKKLDYYLSTLDPNNNFESDNMFYSDKDFVQDGLTSSTLFDDKITLDFNEIVYFKEDDPDTDDVDESTEVDQRLSPRVRIPLDTSFFQQYILDKEGDDVIIDNNLFQEYFNGIVIDMQPTNPLMMQLNFGAGQIKINYDYKELTLSDDGDAANADDYVSQDSSSTFSINLGGVRFNTITQSAPDSEIQTALNGNDDGQNIYLKGGLGVFSTIDLFAGADGQSQLENLQANPWLINEANLILHVDQQKINALGIKDLPNRLYLFTESDGSPLEDFSIDASAGPYPEDNKTTFGGLAQYDDEGELTSYKFVITKHISNLIRESADFENVRLGLSTSTPFINTQISDVISPTEFSIPQSTISTPTSVILAGPNHSNPDLRLQLEIYYTAYE